ncbi:MAG: hypothetical protein A4E54_00077 [Pelotomaculum sp. PtaB.Bin117]|nr:MAG: hypothetical protein A4E54_00077 [Pelotomaculum sp. PtaB.Bin117]
MLKSVFHSFRHNLRMCAQNVYQGNLVAFFIDPNGVVEGYFSLDFFYIPQVHKDFNLNNKARQIDLGFSGRTYGIINQEVPAQTVGPGEGKNAGSSGMFKENASLEE